MGGDNNPLMVSLSNHTREERMTAVSNGTYMDVEGLRTFYVKIGSGPAIFLIHGAAAGGCARVNWGLNIEPLAAAGFTAYAFDQPGFGYTDNPSDYSMEFRVRHAQAFINACGVDRFHVMGNSQGAYIAARIALADQRVERLVLVSSGTLSPRGSDEAEQLSRQHAAELREYRPGLENMRAMTSRTLFNQALVTDELVQLRYEMSTGKNFEAQEKRWGAPGPEPIHEQLRHLGVKTLIFTGKNDRGVALERSLMLFELIPDAELHIFSQCAHWVQWDQAAHFNRMVADFLAEASGD